MDADEGKEMEVNLLGPTVLPTKRVSKKKRSTTQRVNSFNFNAKPKKKSTRVSKAPFLLKNMSGAVTEIFKILDIICPGLRRLAESLSPVLESLRRLSRNLALKDLSIFKQAL